MPVPIYDGHLTIAGMDADSDPAEISKATCHKAVNRIFRGGRNRTRPPFHEITLVFENTDDETWFRDANFQGWAGYIKIRPARKDGLVVSIAGRIFFISLVNEIGYVKKIFQNNNPNLMRTAFCQCEEWMYIQNGKDPAIFWDGFSTPIQSKGVEGKQMPIGTIMASAHGRMFVGNAYNQIWASDIMFGNGFTNTANVQNGVEGIYAANGGSFSLPIFLGPLSGMNFLPVMGQNNRGQGPLIVFGTEGAITLDVGQNRTTWGTSNIQKIDLVGRGCIAPETLILVNGDIWFQSDDGISSLVHAVSEENQRITFRKISRPVNIWLDDNTPYLRPYASAIFFDNRFITTVEPEVSLTRDWGKNRYFRGMVVCDLETLGGDGLAGLNWDGLWTGIRPCGLVKTNVGSVTRAFAFSHDTDGKNRIYEIMRQDGGDDNGKKQIESFYATKYFTFRETGASEFELKTITGGDIFVSEVTEKVKIEVDFKSDYQKNFNEIQTEEVGCASYKDNLPITAPKHKRLKFISVDGNKCNEDGNSLGKGYLFQMRVAVKGNARVNRMRLKCISQETNSVGDCDIKTEDNCQPPGGIPDGDFNYHIV